MSLRRDARAEGLEPGWAGSRDAGDDVESLAKNFVPRAGAVYDNAFYCSKAELAAARAVWLSEAESSPLTCGSLASARHTHGNCDCVK